MWDTNLQHAIQLVSYTNTREPRATRALVTVTFGAKRLLIMFPYYTVQTMASNTSSRLLLTI